MSGKKKLAQFAELKTFKNVFEVSHTEAHNTDFKHKGSWHKEVFKNQNPITLELGCGKGEYTVGMARKYPDRNFIGVDIKGARMWRGAKTAIEEKLDNVIFLRSRIEFIESFFDTNEVTEIWITFPDPQPQESREKKRLTSPRFIEKYLQFLDINGFIHLKTDALSLYEYSDEIGRKTPLDILISTSELYKDLSSLPLGEIEKEVLKIPTFYEQKFIEKGHEICYLKMQRK